MFIRLTKASTTHISTRNEAKISDSRNKVTKKTHNMASPKFLPSSSDIT